MRHKIRNNERPDRFSAYLQRRLADHRQPVDEACWEAIEKEMERQKSFSSRRYLWWTVAAVAAATVSILLFLPFGPDRPMEEKIAGWSSAENRPAKETRRERAETGPKDRRFEEAGRPFETDTLLEAGKLFGKPNQPGGATEGDALDMGSRGAATVPGRKGDSGKLPGATDHTGQATAEILSRNSRTEKRGGEADREKTDQMLASVGPGNESSTERSDEATVRSERTNTEDRTDRLNTESRPKRTNEDTRSTTGRSADESERSKGTVGPPVAPETGKGIPVYDSSLNSRQTRRTKSEKTWLIAAAVGTGNGISPWQGADDLDFNPSQNYEGGQGVVVTPSRPQWTENIPRPKDFQDVSYSLPLSAGVTVRKELNDWLGVESGLVYTYLSAKFTASGMPHYDGRLELHYLGIPFDAVAQVWKKHRWSAYLSVGGMVEKGLQAVYRVEASGGQGVRNLSYADRKGISGLQFSIHGAMGLSYRFYGRWSLYAEPRFSYYFDGDQPLSIRTDKPLVVGLGAGVRFAL